MFFNQSPSFLSHQRAMQQAKGCNNAQSLFGITQIMSDNQTRNNVDPIAPNYFYPVFSNISNFLDDSGYLDNYRFFDDCLLVPMGAIQNRSKQIKLSRMIIVRD